MSVSLPPALGSGVLPFVFDTQYVGSLKSQSVKAERGDRRLNNTHNRVRSNTKLLHT